MGAIQDIFRQYALDYLKRFASTVSAEQRKVIEAIGQCRTEALGSVCYRCEDCGCPHVVPAACGNRHCPRCQHRLGTPLARPPHRAPTTGAAFHAHLLPVPAALRGLLSCHQRLGYGALFEASSQSIKTLVRDSRFVGGDEAGFFGVLHTWGRQLQYHPHIHYVVPGGALSSDDGTWHAASSGFFLPVHALSKIFRGPSSEIGCTGPASSLRFPPRSGARHWNVHCAAVPNAEASIQYLAPYVFKMAISNHRIVRVEDGQVTFSYHKPGSARPRTLTLDALEFIRRFLQHVLPSGFMKVRDKASSLPPPSACSRRSRR